MYPITLMSTIAFGYAALGIGTVLSIVVLIVEGTDHL